MPTLICPVTRKVATEVGPQEVLCELVNWSGVALILHQYVSNQRILGQPEWTCSHERTGVCIASGSSPETALAAAIEKIRPNFGVLLEVCAPFPILNP